MEYNRHDNLDSVKVLKLGKLAQRSQTQKWEKNSNWELAWIFGVNYGRAFQFCMNIGASTYQDHDKFTCIAGGPIPLPGRSPIESAISSSLSSSSICTAGKDGGSLANLALIAER